MCVYNIFMYVCMYMHIVKYKNSSFNYWTKKAEVKAYEFEIWAVISN